MLAVETYDAVIVGARCAGATLALAMAGRGARVLMVDEATFPSDTISTHYLYPNTLTRLDELGVMDRLVSAHKLHETAARITIWGREIMGRFTPIGGYDRGMSITRPVLDQALIDEAIAAGANAMFGVRVAGLIGDGRDDPLAGVTLENGNEIRARRVVGADGRTSVVARALGLPKRNEMAGGFSMLYAYVTGLPPSELWHLDVTDDRALTWLRCEDETHLVILSGPPTLTRGDAATRERTFEEGIRLFPNVLSPDAFDRTTRLSDIRVVPETMLRGFYRQAAGPGWVLVGDSGHFKHPATAQGISDAIEQALHVAEALDGADPSLAGYEQWRDERAAGHYEFSFQLGAPPVAGVAERFFDGLASEPDAVQDFLDVFTRRLRPREAITKERLGRWFG
jgi:2-polyprenyl-6-methoxyphenol hydroxylase-like FAD-dependent oxidoreductase